MSPHCEYKDEDESGEVMDQGEVVEKESHHLVVKGGELVGFNMVVEDS